MPREVSTPLVVPKPGPPPSPPTPPPSRGFPVPSSARQVAALDPAGTTGPQAPLPLSLLTGPFPALPTAPLPAAAGPPSSRSVPAVGPQERARLAPEGRERVAPEGRERVAPEGREREGIPLRYVILSAIFLAIAVVGFGVWLVFGVISL
jgi:hypothetical protein